MNHQSIWVVDYCFTNITVHLFTYWLCLKYTDPRGGRHFTMISISFDEKWSTFRVEVLRIAGGYHISGTYHKHRQSWIPFKILNC